jgi:sugar phosphate isomerase/epimerase
VELSLAPGAGGTIETVADLDRYLGAVAAGGFSSVSLGLQQLQPVLLEPRRFEIAAELMAAHGLRCPDVIGLTVRRDDAAALQATELLCEAAGALGAESILTILFTRVSDESLDRLGRCGELAAQVGARLAMEFVPGGPVSRISQALEVVDAIGPDRMGVLIDTWHFFRGGSTFEELETIPLDRIAVVQFDDGLPAEGDDVMHETTDRRTWPGLGEFDLDRFARVLTDRGWSGLVSVEVLSAELRRLDLSDYTAAAYATTAPYWT